MTTAEAPLARQDTGSVIEQVLLQGDLGKLSQEQRVHYYREVCQSLTLNELTKPFDYIVLNGKLTLYANKGATDQLRGIRGVSIDELKHQRLDDLYVVTARAHDKTGRTDSAIGAVSTKGLAGESLANAMMKAETKAKRRVTLSLCGLGMLDETEVESIPNAQVVRPPLEPAEQKRLAQQYVEIHGDDGAPDRVQALLIQNAKLQQRAADLHIPGLRQFNAQSTWPVERVEAANGEVSERIREREEENDAREALAGQVELPA